MASYISHSASRDNVTLMFSKAEADALLAAATSGEEPQNGSRRAAFERAVRALSAATNTNARRAGFFDHA